MEFKVENGVKMLEAKGGAAARRYPFAAMVVGESFCVAVEFRKNVASAASRHKSRHPGMDFSTRLQDDGTVRVWRTA